MDAVGFAVDVGGPPGTTEGGGKREGTNEGGP